MKRLLVIRNPAAGQRRAQRYAQALAALGEAGCAVTVAETAARGDATRIAADVEAGTFDAVIAAGGDGTINEVVNGLAGRGVPLGIVPLGTSNVLAHEIGVGDDPLRAARAILGGRRKAIALARANGRLCCLMVSAGYDARAIRRVRPALKKLFGEAAYYLAGLEEMLAGGRTMLTVEADGARCEASSVIVANGRLYGGKYLCAPDADLTAPDLQVVTMRRAGRWNALRYGLALMRGRLHELPDVQGVPATRIRILGPAGEPWQSDGDLLGTLPVTITVEPAAIEVLVPAAIEVLVPAGAG